MKRLNLAFWFILTFSFLQSLNAQPAFEWIDQVAGAGYEEGKWIGIDASGNVISIGNFSATADFDPDAGTYFLTSKGGKPMYDSKLDASLIYPNPTEGNITLDLGTYYPSAEIAIADIRGRLIESKSHTDARIVDVFIQGPAGVYLLEVNAGDMRAVVRVVKE